MNRGLITILVATAYALTGRLALMLAVDPGFATPIFPPAGIAAATALVWGWPAVLGVGLGSLLMNLTIQSQFDGPTLALCTAIACGAAAQAALTRYLVRRFVSREPDLRRDTELIRFVLAAGPLACWLNSLISPLALYTFGRVGSHDLLNSILNWYVGDSIGAVFFAALVYVWLVKLPLASRIRTFSLPLVGCFAVAVAGFMVIEANRRAQVELDVSTRVNDLREEFEKTVRAHELALRTVAGFFDSSDDVNRDEFRTFTRVILSSVRDIRSLAWLPRLSHPMRSAYERDAGVIVGSDLKPRAVSEYYYPVTFIESTSATKSIAFDFASERRRAAGIAAALAKRGTVATGVLDLVRSDVRERAFVEITPVFRGASMPIGLITAVVTVEEFFTHLLGSTGDPRDITASIVDVTDGSAERIFMHATWDEKASIGRAFEKTFDAALFGRTWRFTVRPTPTFLAGYQGRLALAGWWLVTLLCVTSILGFTGRHETVRRLVGERTDELTRANERLRKLASEKTEFLANMSHEIRTPLNGVIGLTQILLERELPQAERAIATNIATCGRSVLGVINDILDVSRMEAGKLTLVPAPFDLRQVVDDAVSVVRSAANEKRLTMLVHVAPDVPASIVCDPQRYQQILLNLLSNAVKFTEQGHVTVSISAADGFGGKVELLTSVTDTGIGLTEAGKRLIFGRFEQAAFPSGAQRPTGSGLGLAIARNMAKLMGGRIWVDSEPGRGSTFSFTIQAERGESAVSSRIEPASVQSGLRILVAEDDPVNQLVIRTFLEKAGYLAEIADNGRDAVELYKTKGPFDLVLMDVHMPVMSGLEATRAMRADAEIKPQPRIVALTAALLAEEQAAYFDAGMDAVLPKPLERERLHAILKGLDAPKASQPEAPAQHAPTPTSAAAASAAAVPDEPGRLRWPWFVSWTAAFYVTIVFAQALARSDLGFIAFWPPGGVMLAALLLTPGRGWWALLSGAVAVNSAFNVIQGGHVPLAAVTISVGNALAAWVTAALLTFRTTRLPVAILSRKRLPRFIGAIALGGVPVAATFGALTLRLTKGLDFGATWATWWTADVLGVMLAAPLALTGFREINRARAREDEAESMLPRGFGEALAVITALTIIGTLALSRPHLAHVLTLGLPILLWATMRLSAGLLLSAHFTAALLLLRQPLFGTGNDATVVAQLVSICIIASSLYLSALLRDNRQRARRLKEARRRAEQETDARRDFLVRLSHDLRTPIHGILGSVDALSDMRLDAHEQKHLSTLKESAWRLDALFDRIVKSRNGALPALASAVPPPRPAPQPAPQPRPKERVVAGSWTIDVAMIQRRHDCDLAFVATIAQRFRELAPIQLQGLGEAALRGDARATHVAAHTLKGMVANFFCEELVERCRLIEVASAEGRISVDADALASLERDVLAYAEALLAAVKLPRDEAAG